MRRYLIGFLFVAILFPTHAKKISLMAYNTENLFDTVDDPNTNDETFLPLSQKQNPAHRKLCKKNRMAGRMWECLFLDWSPENLKKKMQNLAGEIFKAPGPNGPDVLILSEVENKGVVEQLNSGFLTRAHYKVLHIQSADKRGISQAVLTRLPVIKIEYHEEKAPKKSRSKKMFADVHTKELRGILEVQMDIGLPKPRLLHVLALHLPSQGASFSEREFLLTSLNNIAQQIPANDVVVAGGDFNISSSEWEDKNVYKNYLASQWMVSHVEGCEKCRGTYAYRKQWSFFDMLLLRKDRENKPRWHWDRKSIQVINGGLGFPVRFDANTGKGASDHFPIYGEFNVD